MAWVYGVATNASVRDIVHLSIGGDQIRIRISNALGTLPVFFGAASVGVQAQRAQVVPGTIRALTFGGSPSVALAPGQVLYSDPVAMQVQAGESLAVSVFVSHPSPVDLHVCCPGIIRSYYTPNNAGNHVNEVSGTAFATADLWDRWVDAVDVSGSSGPGTIAALGDSITDGFHSTLRWTRVLDARLGTLPADQQPGLINEAITANTLTNTALPNDSSDGGGPPGLLRLQRDVLSQSGVTSIIEALGTNDLYFGDTGDEVIAGLQQLIAAAHQAGLVVVGTTILPRQGSVVDKRPWTPVMESYRQQINTWIRTSGAFDGVVDFARVTEDAYDGACQPNALFPPYDSGDHLHPGAAGETAMGNAVATTLLGLPDVPTVVPLVAVQRTPGCDPGPTFIASSRALPSPSPSPPSSPSPAGSPSALAVPGRSGRTPLHRGLPGAVADAALVGLGIVFGIGIASLVRRRPGRTAGGRHRAWP